MFAGLIIVTGVILYRLLKGKHLHSVREQLEPLQESGLQRSKGIDQLWQDLQEWESREPRDTELVWNELQTDISVLPLPANDPQFFLQSILTPTSDTGEELHIVVEMQTGYIVQHAVNDEDYGYDKNSPFDCVPFVKEHRFILMLDVMERKDLKKKLENAAFGKISGGYSTALDDETRQVREQMLGRDAVALSEQGSSEEMRTDEGE